jgi:hypothetical protein
MLKTLQSHDHGKRHRLQLRRSLLLLCTHGSPCLRNYTVHISPAAHSQVFPQKKLQKAFKKTALPSTLVSSSFRHPIHTFGTIQQ